MVITIDGEARITNMLMPKPIQSYGNDIEMGWILTKFHLYDAPNNKKPLKKVIDESVAASQAYTYNSNKLTKTAGLVQLQEDITAGNGYTLRSIAFELDEYETNVFPGTNNAHNYYKIAWERLPDFVKTANTDFTLVTNVYIKRL
jgi:hypothetical protein